ncbi:MAG: leucine--tRNA ligase [Candidatus Daviesbacteria bacterium]|nr:leucine--tRNA ligase [Candidatus Daviesbacteria bacterium]
MKKYIPSDIEPKWQKKWRDSGLYLTDLSETKKKYYCLVELPYTSGDLHMGHWFTFTIGDILARLKRRQGFNVLFPNGFDAFGLPAENAAIKEGIHPRDWTYRNMERMRSQFETLGTSIDWTKTMVACDPKYYKWNQWIFLQMLAKNIAYRGKSLANWCPNCQTVLANENVEAGHCWRCGTEVVQKEVEQWFFRITDYADRLLWQDPPQADWTKSLRVGQNDWIGKSEGVMLRFKVKDMDVHFEMFDSVPQTFMAQTFTVIAPEHPMVYELVKGTGHEKEVMDFVEKIKEKKKANRFQIDKDVEGIFTGRYLEYTPTGQNIPIWVASFVIFEYGTGVVNCSVHDERDFVFAKKYGIPLHPVMFPKDPAIAEKVRNLEICYHHAPEGILEEPVEFKDRKWGEIREDIIKYIEQKGFGKHSVQYHLHDWSISRQRYWGTPIPIIYCDKCGTVPVPEKDLPVELPYRVDYAPKGKPPLATTEDWVNTECPKCGGPGKREVETMDTFVDSAWYFFRYLDPENDQEIFDKKIVANWMPLEIYIGGPEHTLGHALYSRFFTMIFKDLGLINFDEYAKKRIHHGTILGPDGSRMSKSRGNVVNPDEEVKKYGADAIRLYLMFLGPFDIVTPWNPDGVNGVYHFLQRVWGLCDKVVRGDSEEGVPARSRRSEAIEDARREAELAGPRANDLRMMHKTIKKVTEDVEQLKFNTAIASLMEWLNHLSRKEAVSAEEYRTYLQLLAPFAPHITEEIWQNVILGRSEATTPESKEDSGQARMTGFLSIHQQSWPKSDKKYLEEEEFKIAVQVDGKVRDVLLTQKDILSNKEVVEKMARESQKTRKFLEGKSVKKIVYIPGKVFNFVTSPD